MTSSELKEYGLSIGYQKVGIASTECLSSYVEEIQARGEEYDFFRRMLTKPIQKNAPNTKSILVLVRDYYETEPPESLAKLAGKIYLNRCYTPPVDSLEGARLQLMKDYLERQGCGVSSGGLNVPARWVAAQAGVTTFGRNNFAYTEEAGSYLVIHTLLLDMELEYDQPTMESPCPPGCRACINACPTKALYAPFHLDPRRCIAFNHWITQTDRPHVSPWIPDELRDAMGCSIHGCDICQDVCPRNQGKRRQPKPADPYLEHIAPEFTLPAILHMSDDFFERRIRPLFYNYIGEKRYFMRNAAIAMGNSGDSSYLGDLALALDGPDELVRESAAWALGKLGGPQAEAALKRRQMCEPSEIVNGTIKRALSKLQTSQGRVDFKEETPALSV